MSWFQKLDDLNKDDRITLDVGDMLVTGFYKGIQRRPSQDGIKMFIVLAEKQKGKMQQKWVWTKEIQDLKVVKRAGT